MWLSRFGRTVAGQVVDAVTGRLWGPPGGSQVTLGGQGIDLSAPSAGDDVRRALGGLPGAASDDAPPAGRGAWEAARTGAWDDPETGATARSMTGHELLLGSSFHLAAGGGEAGGPGYAAWGRVAVEAEGHGRRGATGLWCTRGRSQDRAGDGEAGGWACGAWSGGARGRSMQSVLRAARWVRIFSMSSGVSMHAMTRNVAPHTPQCSMSTWKTRLSRCIQLMGAGRDA